MAILATTKRTGVMWWIDRWRKSTAFTDMTLEEQGAYRNLLDEGALRGGPIPDDDRILGKACGDALRWRQVKAAVLARFTLTAEGWRNETLDLVLQQADARTEAARAAARTRWGPDATDDAEPYAPLHASPHARRHANAHARRDAKQHAPKHAPKHAEPYASAMLLNPDPDLDPDSDPERARNARAREIPPDSPKTDALALRAGAFVDRYRDAHLRYRKAAYIGNARRDYDEARALVQTFDDATLDRLIVVFLNADDEFSRNGTATVAKFRSRASWCQERVIAEGLG